MGSRECSVSLGINDSIWGSTGLSAWASAFLFYISDISTCSNLGKFVFFAVDTNLFVEGETAKEAFKKANEVLSALNVYMILNKFHIKMTKCCYIHFKLW